MDGLATEIEKIVKAPVTRDYFAEMYVAGVFAGAHWNIYFPRRDQGFDFIVSKIIGGKNVLLPVQVKGKYPEKQKTDKQTYGYIGKLSQTHPDMILAIAYFSSDMTTKAPETVAYMPMPSVRKHARGYFCCPASFENGLPIARRNFRKYFDKSGLELLER